MSLGPQCLGPQCLLKGLGPQCPDLNVWDLNVRDLIVIAPFDLLSFKCRFSTDRVKESNDVNDYETRLFSSTFWTRLFSSSLNMNEHILVFLKG